MDIITKIAQELGIRGQQVLSTVTLIDEGNTIPFIARYRKEVTGGLDDEVLRNLSERLTYLRNLEDKKQTVISSIEEQGKMTDELRAAIEAAETQVAVDDLYRPYRPKRRTRATVAKERGLEPLALLIFAQEITDPIEKVAEPFADPENDVHTVEDAIAGARDIIAEMISDEAQYRTDIRAMTQSSGKISSTAKDPEAQSVYEMYYDYSESVSGLPGHRVLAINRGEKEDFLTVKISAPEEDILNYLKKAVIKSSNPVTTPILEETIADAYSRLIAPAIEREIRNDLTEMAEDGAIHVFGKNLEQLLMQPPIVGKVVLGWDPAFRTGCKLAVVDPTGKVLDTTVIYPTAPQNRVDEAVALLKKWIDKYKVDLISVGNGTASRESEQIIADMIHQIDRPVQYVIVSEAGASVYSASKLASEEFPEFDVGQRSATSIARRLQDPLAELVKIDPQSIGVGQYQHDMNQKKLSEALAGVVEDSVNRVGVDLNTASAPLLSYVAGISKTIAKNIVTYREENGSFTKREQLLSVSKLGPKAYEQCAGFLRIREGENPLDATGVHPESYDATDRLLAILGHDPSELKSGGLSGIKKEAGNVTELAEKLELGVPTLEDILKELEKPGRDPREDMPRPILRSDVLELSDLKPGMVLKGTVRNIVDFGAFVDIGVHQDGLVHISHMTDKYIKHPLEVVSVGDIVDVEVLDVDVKKERIALSMRIGHGDVAGETGKPSKEKKEERKSESRHGGNKPKGNRPDRKKGDRKDGRRGGDRRDDRGGNNGSFGSSLSGLLKDIKL